MEGEDPITLATAATVGGAGMGAVGSIGGGMQAQAAGSYQAQVLREQASAQMAAANQQIAGEDKNASAVISRGVANRAASGGGFDSANPVISDDYSEQKIRDMYTRYSGQLEANQTRYEADISRYEGKQAFISGIFGAGKSILGGVSSLANMKILAGMGSGSSATTGTGTP